MPQAAPGNLLRIGVFGGAFDPPHCAHQALAEAAIVQLSLDRLHILPTGQAWHKSRTLTVGEHRLAMCRLAFGHLPAVHVDDRELRRPSATYTIDTLEEFQREYPGARFFLIVGEDQLRAFRTWRRWQDVLSVATLVVAGRPGAEGDSPLSEGCFAADEVPFQRLLLPLSPASSTDIRSRLADPARRSAGLAALVPEAVAGYISNHSLYQQPS
ncbi:nicotinate (nicotinamide) nucleotide adenylyltransferase [Hydrogenophaga sp. RWCD_12]|uniref:nicotinate (nicotinamide) nucleotide adenylyltransferase n=1 Tax=Hydrogenophaga sp. RWCD_12 TaxID=3391190 RepID=UPI003984B28F